ncbi:hypothetical protein LEP1GSC191_1755 [Leptospira borgpetersenii serovar Mini str. 201000851]|uniref:Uncharacterized protein n=1 Tax=Leptospira borgpetersenii str. 200801926 TaxID=1193009 RepID=A0ABP2S3J5_LEPBO|nr:hypothetical protein LEP1GSC128_3855 [Leptospira borgpetersenii str. 200801926]ENO64776.1 hypothetical protein LEP1GSC191_1755 [Leptospira borgpetersenii serovar Mini str. 201000851]
MRENSLFLLEPWFTPRLLPFLFILFHNFSFLSFFEIGTFVLNYTFREKRKARFLDSKIISKSIYFVSNTSLGNRRLPLT